MYDSIYVYIERYNDLMIKSDAEIENIIKILKVKPTNNKIQDFCKYKDMQKTYLNELIKKIKSKGYHLSELLYRKNLNDFKIKSVRIKYDNKIHIFSNTSFYSLKSIINDVVKNIIIEMDSNVIDEYVNTNLVNHDENEEYRYIANKIKTKNIEIIGVLYNKTKNEYLPFEFNYV